MKPFFSVIVPVYKVENYLKKCVESITNQTFDDFELVLVDDGSPDNCPEMCDNFAQNDSRINVVHKQNGGLSDARNAGVEHSTGEYIIFIDSDDYWTDNDFLKNSYEILKNTDDDILLFGYKEVNSKGDIKPKMDFTIIKGNAIQSYTPEFCMDNGFIISSACTKIVRRKFIAENSLAFRLGVHSEDVEWTAKLISKCNSYSIYPDNIYAYYQNSESITHKIKEADVQMLIDNIERCLDILKQCDKNNESVLYSYISYQYITLINIYLMFARTGQIKKRLMNYRYLLKYNKSKKVRLIYIFDKLFGFTIMTKILYVFLKIRYTGR